MRAVLFDLDNTLYDRDAAFRAELAAAVALDDGARRLLDALVAAALPFGVVTNGSAAQGDKVRRLGLDGRAACVVVSEVVGVRKNVLLTAPSSPTTLAEHPSLDGAPSLRQTARCRSSRRLGAPTGGALANAQGESPMAEAHRSSTGHDFAGVGWLDAHYETCQPEYEAMLRAVGIRPGGLIALKDFEGGHLLFGPADPALRWHLYDALARERGTSAAHIGTLRPRHMRAGLREARCTDVWQRTTLAERRYPLVPAARAYIGNYFESLARVAPQMNIEGEELAFWQRQGDRDAPEAMINQPDFYWCEGHVLAVGRVRE